MREQGPSGCHGTGAGWGTIEGRRLRVLVLGSASSEGVSRAIARAIGKGHDVTVLVPARAGLFSRLAAARAASALRPDLIHAVGTRGAARAAASIAAGTGVPLVSTLLEGDLASAAEVKRFARSAAAIVLGSQAEADAFRAAGYEREVYVMSTPAAGATDDDRFFLGSIEVVYGRVIASGETPAEPAPTDADGTPLVGIGRKRSRGERPA